MGVIKADKVIARKNSAGSDFSRRRLNLIEGTNVTLTVADDPTNNEIDVTIAASGGGGSGDVVGPASAVANNVVLFDGTTGKLIKDSGLALSGSNTGDQTITLTGDVTGSGTGSFATALQPATVGYTELDAQSKFPAHYTFIASTTSKLSAVVTSAAGVVTLTVQKDGTGDFDILFSSGFTTVDATPALTATLTAGSDTSPQVNYAYIRKATPTVVTVSTTSFPTGEEYLHVGKYLVPSAATVATYGVFHNQRYADELWSDTTDNGHQSHINEWIRAQPATWISGAALTPTLTTASTPDTLTVAVSSGSIRQLHVHSFPAFDSATGGTTNLTTFFSPNHATAYTSGKDLATANFLQDSAGNAVTGTNKRISWVVWGAVSENSGDNKVFVNLPSGFYLNDSTAISDDLRYTTYTIPSTYQNSGFLIAKLTYHVTNSTPGSYALTLIENIDLRGQLPTVGAGGTSAGSTTFADNVFEVYDETDTTKRVVFSNGGATTGTATTIAASQTADRTITLPDVTSTLYGTGSGSITSAQLATSLTDETGSGVVVFATSPTLVTPILGVAAATSINKVTVTAPATSATLTIADGKTLTMSNTLTFTGTDASSVAFGAGGTVAYIANKLSVFAATTSAELAGVISDETGSGALVFATSPTLVTPVLGAATATSINGVTINANLGLASITFIIDGGGATITTGIKGDLQIPFDCTINSVTMVADQSGSIVVDLWKDTYANFAPTVADTITAAAKPTITTATKSTDATLTGWTTSVTAGDIIRYNVDSVTTIQRVTITLKVTKI